MNKFTINISRKFFIYILIFFLLAGTLPPAAVIYFNGQKNYETALEILRIEKSMLKGLNNQNNILETSVDYLNDNTNKIREEILFIKDIINLNQIYFQEEITNLKKEITNLKKDNI